MKLKEYGVTLARREGKLIITADKRLAKIVEKYRGRIEGIVERELVRLLRIKGLEIEDERAKTYFLQSIGYLIQLDYIRSKTEEVKSEIEKTAYPGIESFTKVARQLENYNRTLNFLRKDHTFGYIAEGFNPFSITWSKKKGIPWLEYDIVTPQGIHRWGRMFLFLNEKDKETLIEFLDTLIDEINILIASILGKIISGK